MKSALKLILKAMVILLLASCLLSDIGIGGTNVLFVLPILLLVTGLALLRHWFPFFFNLIKRVFVWMLKGIAGWLWRKPERKGGATIRSQKIRWRS